MQISKALCQKFREEPNNTRWNEAGKTNDTSAQTVLPTSDTNTPNPGTYEAKTAKTTTKIARVIYIAYFPNLVVEYSLLWWSFWNHFPFPKFLSTISLIGCTMIGNVKIIPKHRPTC